MLFVATCEAIEPGTRVTVNAEISTNIGAVRGDCTAWPELADTWVDIELVRPGQVGTVRRFEKDGDVLLELDDRSYHSLPKASLPALRVEDRKVPFAFSCIIAISCTMS